MEPLFSALTDSDQSVRLAATHALLALVKTSPPDLYIHHLQKASPDSKRVAAYALASIQNLAARPVLLEYLNSPDSSYRALGIRGLRQLHETSLLAQVTGMLKDPDPLVRGEAILYLGELGDKTAIPLLKAAAKKTGEDLRVVLAAQNAITRLSGQSPVSPPKK